MYRIYRNTEPTEKVFASCRIADIFARFFSDTSEDVYSVVPEYTA